MPSTCLVLTFQSGGEYILIHQVPEGEEKVLLLPMKRRAVF